MKADVYKKHYSSLLQEVNTTKGSNILLSFALVLSLYMNFSSDKEVVLVPPRLDERITLAYNNGDSGWAKSWATHYAMLLGNAHPGNAEFIADEIKASLSSHVASKVNGALGATVFKIKKDGLSSSFSPRETSYEAKTNKVFVLGDYVSFTSDVLNDSRYAKKKTKKTKVYEFILEMENGRPSIKHFDQYFGQKRDLVYIERMKALQEKGGSVK